MALKGLLNSAYTIVLGHYGGGGGEDGKACHCGQAAAHNGNEAQQKHGFQMPLHYPRYKKEDYETMEEWQLYLLLNQYGLSTYEGTLQDKREFAIGAFVWPTHDDYDANLTVIN